jgi:hypothetical protein
VLGSRERARENHLASPWAQLKHDVKFALRERFAQALYLLLAKPPGACTHKNRDW